MLSYIFGLPGSGKSTYLCYLARREIRRINRRKSSYERVLANFDVKGCYRIDFKDLGQFDTSNSLILIDEATLDCDSRDFKRFSDNSKYFFLMHRHYGSDIWIASQQYDGVDKKIRDITQRMLYIRRLPFGFSSLTLIPQRIIIPEDTGEIKQGYIAPKLIQRMITTFGAAKLIWRPLYYKYFDSYCRKILPVKAFKKI